MKRQTFNACQTPKTADDTRLNIRLLPIVLACHVLAGTD